MGKLVYDGDYMDSIATSYQAGASIVARMIDMMETLENNFAAVYEGQGKAVIVPEVFDKLIEHLELLKLCYSNAGEYVTNSKESMKLIDEVGSAQLGGF